SARTSTSVLAGDCGPLNPIETARLSAKRPVVSNSPVGGTEVSVSRAWAWQVAVAWVVDAPMDRSMTVTGAATEVAGSDAVGPRLAMVACDGDTCGSGGRLCAVVSASLSIRGPNSAKPAKAAEATSTLARTRLRGFSSGSGS